MSSLHDVFFVVTVQLCGHSVVTQNADQSAICDCVTADVMKY